MNMLEVCGLTVGYGKTQILSELSFSLHAGEWLMVTGPNGSGKSTLVNALSGALQYDGTIRIMGDELRPLCPDILAKRLGVLSQENHVGYDFTVEELVSLGRYAYRRGFFSRGEDRREHINAAMELTGVEHLRDRSALTLSGGELQRVFLAQLLVQDPQILVLDEPTSHLDLSYQMELLEIVAKWLRKGERAVISVVHDLSLARAWCSHALLLGGEKGIYGSCREVLSDDNLNRVYGMDVRSWMLGLLDQWTDDIPARKKALRREILGEERNLTAEEKRLSDAEIDGNLLNLPEYEHGDTIFCFVSTASEPDTMPILRDALTKGKRLSVPLITGDGLMEAVELHSMDELHPGHYGIPEPDPNLPRVDIRDIDLAVIPCVSCTHTGHRLGRGGGYYDRFLAGFSGKAVLLCREKHVRPMLPTEPHDIPVPIVATDNGVSR